MKTVKKAILKTLAMAMMIAFCLFVSCQKERIQQDGNNKEEDYRDEWVGTWDFTTIDYTQRWMPPVDTLIIDTIRYTGTIITSDTNKLKIVFKPDASDPIINPGPPVIRGIVYPTVDVFGNLSYPEAYFDHGHFRGFISKDSIYMDYSQTYGHFATAWHTITGKKVSKP